jgi:hypothetical protein
MTARYACSFENSDGDDHMITVDLSAREMEIIRGDDNPELMARGFALVHAYKAAPDGYFHRRGGVAAVN